METFRRILCPVDFSEPSDHALDYAISFADRLGAELHVVHVYQVPAYALPDGALLASADFVGQLSAELQKQLDALAAKHRKGDRKLETHLLQGPAPAEIVRLAGEIQADVIVMGTHGRVGLSHFFLGSIAERVVRTSPVPVLTVRKSG